MKKLLALVVVAVLGLLVSGKQAMAAPEVQLNWGSEVNPGQCGGDPGTLVVNVVYKVSNDVDSRVGGGAWASDDYNKHIQIWEVGPGSYCADVRYVGSFLTVAGASPQGTVPELAAGIMGTMEGGYRATIAGTFVPPSSVKTKGNLGSIDYGCNPLTDNGNHNSCTNTFDWVGTYFPDGYNFAYGWWGWIYHGGSNGTWVNASTGNQGDITN